MTWHYVYHQDLWPALVSVSLTIFLGLFSWRRRKVPGARAFAVGCLFAMLWALGSCLEIAAVDVSVKIFWLKFHALWQIPTVTALTCFFLDYAGFGHLLHRRNVMLLSTPAVVIFVLMATDHAHHLIWRSFSLERHVVAEYGPATWASILYANLLGFINIFALIRMAVRTRRARWPVAIMLFGLMSGRIMYVLDSLNRDVFSPGESTFVVIGLSCAAYAFALFHYRILDPIALARTAVIEQMDDGMLVLDMHGHIVDLNPAAASILGTTAADLCGRDVREVLPEEAGVQLQADQLTLTKQEMRLHPHSDEKMYSLSLTRLHDSRGNLHGHLLLLHDITRQQLSQQLQMKHQQVVATLQERDRLARELHDSIGQVLGYISLQAQAAQQWTASGDPGKAVQILGRLVEVAQDAHADVRESITSLKSDAIVGWSFEQALKKTLDRYRASYGMDIELLQPDGREMLALSPEVGVQVLRVMQEAMTNASKHGRARRVEVVFADREGHVHISINDDGIGYNPAGVHPDSGKHFGLMFMRERMSQVGGTVVIASQPGAGTRVQLDVPVHLEQGGEAS